MLSTAKEIQPEVSSDTVRQMAVLVLDDSEVDRKRIIRLCKDAGLNMVAIEVATLDQMREALEGQQFDLVFIDYLLVGEDGLDAVEILNKDPNQTAASIMIAGEGRLDIALEAMRNGCSDYLTKSSLTVEALQKSVASALERRIMGLALKEERDQRHKLEQSIRLYANACSMEMRSILAATLRRVRTLRSLQMSEEQHSQLGHLEASIDKMWKALPSFGEGTSGALAKVERPHALPQPGE